ncbi:uncharacterized protein [Lolium perenne]|uniref:uncharacterized protein n=1 Tax=Lolium perenne TaxID=4522 RepID=UPI0021E9E59C|nr:rapid alkalinization factor 23-like [Lolium perenne]
MARTPASAAALMAASVLLVLLLARCADAGDLPLSWELGLTGVEEVADDGYGFAAGDGDAVVRRVLQGGNGYISYGALRRDNVPCSVRGASYYNCRAGAQANPYTRGCSKIAGCRG